MKQSSTSEAEILQFRLSIQERLRVHVLAAIEAVLEEELTAALGSQPYERTPGRQGYRNGADRREITTAVGTRELRVPRGRVVAADGTTQEFRSELLPRYGRRTQEVDEAILGCYLAGANSRRIRKALAPLLGEQHLSKSAVSRVVGRLKELFACWASRDLSQESFPVVYLDGLHLKVRLARRVISVPVLAALGVNDQGQKVLLALRLAVSEAAASWSGVLEDLQRRGLTAPRLLVVDGHQGLGKALAVWSQAEVQRCTQHKLRNLLEHCPHHAHGELKRDYSAIVFAEDGLAARRAYAAFVDKWQRLCPAVARSLEEAGEELLTFYAFPKAMWKSLRTTNVLENLNREFRRRTKTQGSFATEEAALTLLWGLVAFGQIRMRRITGHRELKRLMETEWTQAA